MEALASKLKSTGTAMQTAALLTTEELAKLAHVAPDTVRYWRFKGQGPKHFRIGGKRVFYRVEDVQEWLDEQYAKANPDVA
jgi:predicted DNA-binding transcriptional regulator AlpA